MYHVEWVDEAGAGEVLGSFLAPDCLDDITTEKGEQLKVPQWEHPGDYRVVAPADESKQEPDLHTLDMCIAAFDGGGCWEAGGQGLCSGGRRWKGFFVQGQVVR